MYAATGSADSDYVSSFGQYSLRSNAAEAIGFTFLQMANRTDCILNS